MGNNFSHHYFACRNYCGCASIDKYAKRVTEPNQESIDGRLRFDFPVMYSVYMKKTHVDRRRRMNQGTPLPRDHVDETDEEYQDSLHARKVCQQRFRDEYSRNDYQYFNRHFIEMERMQQERQRQQREAELKELRGQSLEYEMTQKKQRERMKREEQENEKEKKESEKERKGLLGLNEE